MAVRLVCPSCSAALSVKDEYAGRAIKCPKCGGRIPASQPADAPPSKPSAALPPSPAPEKEPDEPARPKIKARTTGKPDADNEDTPPRRKSRGDDREDDRPARGRRKRDDEDDRPAKKRGGSNVPLIVGVVGGLLLMCCGGLAGIGYYTTNKAKQLEQAEADAPPPPPPGRPKNDRVTAAAFQKLKPLMTQDEVEAVLGPGAAANNSDISMTFPIARPAPGSVLFEWEPKANEDRVLWWENAGDRLFVAFHDKPGAGGKLQVKMFVTGNGGVTRSGEPDDDKFAYDNPQLAKGGPPVAVAATDVTQAAWDDTAAARTRYADKRLAVRGTVASVEEENGEMKLMLKGIDAKEAGRPVAAVVMCQIKVEPERRKVYALSRGQAVTVTGLCTQVEKHFVTLANCSVAPTGPDPAVALTMSALAAEVRADHAATEAKYRGKEVTLRDAIVVKRADDFVSLLVSVGGKEDDTPVVRFAFPRAESGTALKPGTKVTVKGRFRECTLHTVDLEQCWVVP